MLSVLTLKMRQGTAVTEPAMTCNSYLLYMHSGKSLSRAYCQHLNSEIPNASTCKASKAHCQLSRTSLLYPKDLACILSHEDRLRLEVMRG